MQSYFGDEVLGVETEPFNLCLYVATRKLTPQKGLKRGRKRSPLPPHAVREFATCSTKPFDWSTSDVSGCFVGQHTHAQTHIFASFPLGAPIAPGPEPSKLDLGLYLAVGRAHQAPRFHAGQNRGSATANRGPATARKKSVPGME